MERDKTVKVYQVKPDRKNLKNNKNKKDYTAI